MLVIENLVKKYGRFKAVDGLAMHIEKGQIFGFVGSNGAGKTTTMKMAAGLLMPTSGRILVDGIDVVANPGEIKKRIGYMPDFFGVYDDLKVTEYMNFYAGVYGIPSSERSKISDELLELVDLSHKKESYVDTLSRGMKQRLCLARSLIHDPEFLILDEPASGLDPRARVEMKEILKTLKGMGKTVLISSHILPELSELCTSIGIIEKGKLIASGTVEEIMRKISHNRTIRIKVLGEQEPAVRLLKEQPSIGSITVNTDYIDADYQGDASTLANILKSLVGSGMAVTSFTEVEGSLETAFMQLIKGGAENEDESGN